MPPFLAGCVKFLEETHNYNLKDLKEKMDATQRSSRDSRRPKFSKTPKMSTTVKQIRGNSFDRSSTRPLFKSNMDLETSNSQKMKNKGKSVSVLVRDKAKCMELRA